MSRGRSKPRPVDNDDITHSVDNDEFTHSVDNDEFTHPVGRALNVRDDRFVSE